MLFDQRNCGRSTPHASALDTDLASNTTAQLIADMERLRQHLGVERWLVFGGSWGSTLALAYAESYPSRVSEMILFGITTGWHQEIDWLFRGGVSIFFPAEWERLRLALPLAERDGDVVAAYCRRLNDPSLAVRQQAAYAWELKRVWPRGELVVVDNAGHAANHPGITEQLIRATDRFAALR